MIPTSSPACSRFILASGAFRLVLAYIVVIGHSLPFKLGPSAVYLFFALSGYWIYRMWHSTYARTRRPWVTFLISRAWRLVPMYLVALLLTAVVMMLFPEHSYGVPQWPSVTALHFYLSNLFIFGYSRLPLEFQLIPAVWSLDIECQFYLIAPLLILLLDGSRSKAVTILLIGAASCGLVFFLVFFNATTGQTGYLPNYSLFLIVGLLTARFNWIPNPRVALLMMLTSILVIAVCISNQSTRSLFLMGRYTGSLTELNLQANVFIEILLLPYAMSTVRQNPAVETPATLIGTWQTSPISST